MNSSAGTSGVVLDEMPQGKRPRIDAEHDKPLSSQWASLHADALGVVLRFLPCMADCARVRAVCRNWRAASYGCGLDPPLPLLVMPRFRFASMTPRGVLTPTSRRAWMPPELDADRAEYVGSFGSWLACARQAGGECFLVNAFSHKVLHLPPLCDFANCEWRSLHRVELSASPESKSPWNVAAFAFYRSKPELALWRPGMKSWCVWQHPLIAGHNDIVFFKGKLYMLWRFTPSLFVFEIVEDGCGGVKFSRMKDCLLEKLLPTPLGCSHVLSCNMVEWCGTLLLIIRCYGGYNVRHKVLKVQVFAMDLSSTPNSLTEIHSLGGDCIYVGSGGCKSYPAGKHQGIQGDLICFSPDHYNLHDSFVYSMREVKARAIIEPVVPCRICAPGPHLGFPVWLFPPE